MSQTTTGLRFTFLGLSITSSWGNGHATTFRALIRELAQSGHEVVFLERDLPFYAANRDQPESPHCRTILYGSLDELRERYADQVKHADITIVGSYVPQGCDVGAWACDLAPGRVAFYDIDTPVTLAKIDAGDYEYLRPDLIGRYAMYMSFTGGPTLTRLEKHYGAASARPLYCSVDPAAYAPVETPIKWDMGYLGTYSDDRQPALDRLLFEPARQLPETAFIVAGAQYPATTVFPPNVQHIEHLPPSRHCEFYCAQRFTLNITRSAMVTAGWSPSVRLFEAAACGTPIVSDRWPGLEELFVPGREILIADNANDVLSILSGLPDAERRSIADAARARVLAEHTAMHRAQTLVGYAREILDREVRARRSTHPTKRAEAAE